MLKGMYCTEPEIVERMYFDGLLDFVYVEFMKGLQRGFVPKRCAHCGRWFLQKPGMSYTYCDRPSEQLGGKTCRDVGAMTSLRRSPRTIRYGRYRSAPIKNTLPVSVKGQ